MHHVLSLKANYLARPRVKPGPHNRGRNSDLLYFAVSCTPHFFPFFPSISPYARPPPSRRAITRKPPRDIVEYHDAHDGEFMELQENATDYIVLKGRKRGEKRSPAIMELIFPSAGLLVQSPRKISQHRTRVVETSGAPWIHRQMSRWIQGIA